MERFDDGETQSLTLTVPLALVEVSSSLTNTHNMQLTGSNKSGESVSIDLYRTDSIMKFVFSGARIVDVVEQKYSCDVTDISTNTGFYTELLPLTTTKGNNSVSMETVTNEQQSENLDAMPTEETICTVSISYDDDSDNSEIPHSRSMIDNFQQTEKNEDSLQSPCGSECDDNDTEFLSKSFFYTDIQKGGRGSVGEANAAKTFWRSRKEANIMIEKLENKCKLCEFKSLSKDSLMRHVAIKHQLSAIAYDKLSEGILGMSDNPAEDDMVDGEFKECGLNEGALLKRNNVTKYRDDIDDCVKVTSEHTTRLISCSDTFPQYSLGNQSNIRSISSTSLSQAPKTSTSKTDDSANHSLKTADILTKDSVTKHKQIHQVTDCQNMAKDTYCCKLCKKVCSLPTDYRDHLTSAHKDSSELTELLKQFEKSRVNVAKRVSSIEMPCTICGEIFWGFRIFSHLKMWHSDFENFVQIMQNTTSEYNRKRNSARKCKEAGEEKIECTDCRKMFKKASLSFHKKFRCKDNKKRRKLWECGVCGFGTVFEDKYREHLKTHPADKKDYVCELCGQEYRTKGGIQLHCRIKHGMVIKKNLPLMACPECGKEFYSKSHYKRHLTVHTGEAPFRCDECGKCLRDAATLRKHIRTLHRHQYRFSCQKCSRGFERKSALNNHRCVADVDMTEIQNNAALKQEPETDLLQLSPQTVVMDITHSNQLQMSHGVTELSNKEVVYLVDPEALQTLSGSEDISHEILQAVQSADAHKTPLMQILVSTDDKQACQDVLMETVTMEAADCP